MGINLKSVLLLGSTTMVAALVPNCAPGGNLDLSKFSLQLPTGSPGNPTQISASKLNGCNGFQDEWFSTSKSDGTVVFKVPDSSTCVTTKNSKHCRSELRESSPASWSPNSATNRLFADLKVTQAGSGSICVGQIHIDDKVSVRPVAELYYHPDGELTIGVEKTRAGGNQKPFPVDRVTPGARFTYEIRYEKNVLSVSVNGKAAKTFTTFELNAPPSYFKAGNYNQGSDATEVHFYNIRITH
ncbi:family 7 polysaccharide lyase [Trichoderma evansii]